MIAKTNTMPTYALAGITTRWYGPTNTRGSHMRAWRSDRSWSDCKSSNTRISATYDHALDIFANHVAVADALAVKLEWCGEYHAASVASGGDGYVFSRAVTS